MKNLICVVMVSLLASISLAVATEIEKPTEQIKLVITGLVPGGEAEKAGVMENDVLIKYDGKPLSSRNQLNELKNKIMTDMVEITILRDGKEMTFKIPKGPIGIMITEVYPDLKYKDDAVVIEGIPKLGWETGKVNSFLGCVELVANHLGIKKDYMEIDGISGAAFRLHFCEGWCPSSPDPTCGYNSGEDALNALGLEYRTMHLAPDGKNKPEIKKAIMECIDNKMPVIAIDLIAVPEWGLVTGCQDNGEELLCRTYFDSRNSYEIAQKFPWALYLITGQKEMAKDDILYKQSFKTALANLTTDKYDQYYSGINAFDKWIEHLEKSDFAKMDSEKYSNAVLANSWIFDRLALDRNDAVTYLEMVAKAMPELSEQLIELANIYKEESKMLQETKINIPNSNIIKSSSEWTDKMRQEEIALLQKAKTAEEAALKIWQEINKEEK